MLRKHRMVKSIVFFLFPLLKNSSSIRPNLILNQISLKCSFSASVKFSELLLAQGKIYSQQKEKSERTHYQNSNIKLWNFSSAFSRETFAQPKHSTSSLKLPFFATILPQVCLGILGPTVPVGMNSLNILTWYNYDSSEIVSINFCRNFELKIFIF